MKEVLQQQGWSCKKCNCPGVKTDDCSHASFRGFLIKIRSTSFRIFKSGMLIESGHNYTLTDNLKKHGIYKETV